MYQSIMSEGFLKALGSDKSLIYGTDVFLLSFQATLSLAKHYSHHKASNW